MLSKAKEDPIFVIVNNKVKQPIVEKIRLIITGVNDYEPVVLLAFANADGEIVTDHGESVANWYGLDIIGVDWQIPAHTNFTGRFTQVSAKNEYSNYDTFTRFLHSAPAKIAGALAGWLEFYNWSKFPSGLLQDLDRRFVPGTILETNRAIHLAIHAHTLVKITSELIPEIGE